MLSEFPDIQLGLIIISVSHFVVLPFILPTVVAFLSDSPPFSFCLFSTLSKFPDIPLCSIIISASHFAFLPLIFPTVYTFNSLYSSESLPQLLILFIFSSTKASFVPFPALLRHLI